MLLRAKMMLARVRALAPVPGEGKLKKSQSEPAVKGETRKKPARKKVSPPIWSREGRKALR